jgi:hypothetical protein
MRFVACVHAALAVVLLASAPGTTLAQSAAPAAPLAGGEDEVDLNGGGLVRGTVVLLAPGVVVAILVQGSNELLRVPWAEVKRVNRRKNLPPPAVNSPAHPAGPTLGAPRIRIQALSPGVTLYEVSSEIAVAGTTGSVSAVLLRPVCRAPCNQVVDGRRGQSFFFGGDGTSMSSTFHLAERSGDITVDVSPGSASMQRWGVLLTSLGIPSFVTGAILVPIGAMATSEDAHGIRRASPSAGLMVAGGIFAAAGVGLIVGGLHMAFQNQTTFSFHRQGGDGGRATRAEVEAK